MWFGKSTSSHCKKKSSRSVVSRGDGGWETFSLLLFTEKVENPGILLWKLIDFLFGAHGGKSKAFFTVQRALGAKRDRSMKFVTKGKRERGREKLIERCMNAFTSSSRDVMRCFMHARAPNLWTFTCDQMMPIIILSCFAGDNQVCVKRNRFYVQVEWGDRDGSVSACVDLAIGGRRTFS